MYVRNGANNYTDDSGFCFMGQSHRRPTTQRSAGVSDDRRTIIRNRYVQSVGGYKVNREMFLIILQHGL